MDKRGHCILLLLALLELLYFILSRFEFALQIRLLLLYFAKPCIFDLEIRLFLLQLFYLIVKSVDLLYLGGSENGWFVQIRKLAQTDV